jgi:hypothetical protein
MTDWRSVIGDNTHIPDGLDLDQTTTALTALLRSPDPAVRDGFAYSTLARLVPFLDTQQRRRLGDSVLPAFRDAQTQARTFAPLILDVLVQDGAYRPEWQAAFEAWYPNERDLRGHDPELGWLHAFGAAHRSHRTRCCGSRPSGCWRGPTTYCATRRTTGSPWPSP